VQLDVQKLLEPDVNQLAIEAVNATDRPSPAGVLGQLLIRFDKGQPLTVAVDATWKASKILADHWTDVAFNDNSWVPARQIARFGDAPWGTLSSQLTLSPVKADPFAGHCELPADLDLAASRVYLEVDTLAPEEASRITLNDQDAGGFIGRPLRLNVTRYLKPGANRVRIEPFAPAGQVRLAWYKP
jgi:hypothetical protein